MRRIRRALSKVAFRLKDLAGGYRVPASDPPWLAILMFHGLSDDPARRAATRGMDVTPRQCLRQIRFLARQGYVPILPGNLPSDPTPDGARGYLVISFDDGYLNTFAYLRDWMDRYELPFLVSICPGIVETGGVYWWEELWARFAHLESSFVWEGADGHTHVFAVPDCDPAEELARQLPPQELRSFMEQLRDATPELTSEDLTKTPFVHENMSWEALRKLSAHPRCQIGVHSLWHDPSVNMTAEALAADTEECRETIRQELGVESLEFVYPNGLSSAGTEAVLAELGFERSYVTTPGVNRVGDRRCLHRIMGDGFTGNRWYFGNRWARWHRS